MRRWGPPAPDAAGEVGGSRPTLSLGEGWEEARHPPRQVAVLFIRFLGRLGSPGVGSASPPASQGSSPVSDFLRAGSDGDRTQPYQVHLLRASGREATLTEERKKDPVGCQVPSGTCLHVMAQPGRSCPTGAGASLLERGRGGMWPGPDPQDPAQPPGSR